MSNLALRQKLVEIAARDVGKTEATRNRAPWIAKYWLATNAPEFYDRDGPYKGRPPYCAAAVAYWVQQWLALPEVLAALKMTPAQAERWRCKTSGAWAWLDWARRAKGVVVIDDDDARREAKQPLQRLRVGDIMVFDTSHIGLVEDDGAGGIYTIEANTGDGSVRDGDGCWTRTRQRPAARAFIRLIEP